MKKYVYLFCASVFLVCACSEGNPSTSSSENAATAAKNDTTSVGGDRDEHGCIPSAGYVWSAVQGKCIRTFESGVKLLPAEMPTDGSAVFAAKNRQHTATTPSRAAAIRLFTEFIPFPP